MQDAYLDGRKEEAAGRLPAELIENTSLCGDEAYVIDRLAAYKEAGVTSLIRAQACSASSRRRPSTVVASPPTGVTFSEVTPASL